MSKNVKKGICIMTAIMILLIPYISMAEGVQRQIKVDYNKVSLIVYNKKVDTDTILYNSMTYVPLRATADMLNKNVYYEDSTKTAYISDSGRTDGNKTEPSSGRKGMANIDVGLNSINLVANGVKIREANILHNGITYIPFRAVGEIFGNKVLWDGKTYTAIIMEKSIGDNLGIDNNTNIDVIVVDKNNNDKKDDNYVNIEIPAGYMANHYNRIGIKNITNTLKKNGTNISLEERSDGSMTWRIPNKIHKNVLDSLYDNLDKRKISYINSDNAIMDIKYLKDLKVINILIDERIASENTITQGIAFAGEAGAIQICIPSEFNVDIVFKDYYSGNIVETIKLNDVIDNMK